MTAIHFRTKRGSWILLALASAAMAAGGLVLLLLAPDNTPASAAPRLLGWACLLFFGGCALVGMVQATQRGPRLTIDDARVLDRTVKLGVIA